MLLDPNKFPTLIKQQAEITANVLEIFRNALPSMAKDGLNGREQIAVMLTALSAASGYAIACAMIANSMDSSSLNEGLEVFRKNMARTAEETLKEYTPDGSATH